MLAQNVQEHESDPGGEGNPKTEYCDTTCFEGEKGVNEIVTEWVALELRLNRRNQVGMKNQEAMSQIEGTTSAKVLR